MKQNILPAVRCVYLPLLIAGSLFMGCDQKAVSKLDQPISEIKSGQITTSATNPLAISPSTIIPLPAKSKYQLSDAHLHLVDFLQGGDGINAAVSAMDRTGVSDAMLTGMPVVKKWDPVDPRKPLYYLEDDARVYW